LSEFFKNDKTGLTKMVMQILDGRVLAARLKNNLKKELVGVGSFEAFLIGRDPASILYLRKKAEMARELGVEFHLHEYSAKVAIATVIKKIQALNEDGSVAGIMVQLPVPKGFDSDRIVNAITPEKDADGLTDANIAGGEILPATAEGVLQIMRHYKISWKDKVVVLVGFTRLLNVPLSIYLAKNGAQVVAIQEKTKTFDVLKTADIIITAAGKANLISAKNIKKGAVILDAGTNQYRGKLVGDVDYNSVIKKAAAVTPTPGGVGPMTVTSLFVNLAKIWLAQAGK
jgi:methylenetetrahydrofolate dehydrogenase (NADP+) / methenyltetrahydrofolate cyclohydrolase